MLLFLFCKKVATVRKVFITFPNQQIEETKMNWAHTDHTLFLSQGRVKHHLYASHFLSLHTEHASPLQLTLKNKINRPHSHVRYCEAKACSKSTGYFFNRNDARGVSVFIWLKQTYAEKMGFRGACRWISVNSEQNHVSSSSSVANLFCMLS